MMSSHLIKSLVLAVEKANVVKYSLIELKNASFPIISLIVATKDAPFPYKMESK